MATKALDSKKVTSTLLIVIIIIALSGAVALQTIRYNLAASENKSLNATISNLNAKIISLGEKLNQLKADNEKQSLDLESLRNRLTQEKLKNVQLEDTIEQLKSGTSVDSAGSVAMPEEAASSVS